MEENVKRYILEFFREKYYRAGKLGKGTLDSYMVEPRTRNLGLVHGRKFANPGG